MSRVSRSGLRMTLLQSGQRDISGPEGWHLSGEDGLSVGISLPVVIQHGYKQTLIPSACIESKSPRNQQPKQRHRDHLQRSARHTHPRPQRQGAGK